MRDVKVSHVVLGGVVWCWSSAMPTNRQGIGLDSKWWYWQWWSWWWLDMIMMMVMMIWEVLQCIQTDRALDWTGGIRGTWQMNLPYLLLHYTLLLKIFLISNTFGNIQAKVHKKCFGEVKTLSGSRLHWFWHQPRSVKPSCCVMRSSKWYKISVQLLFKWVSSPVLAAVPLGQLTCVCSETFEHIHRFEKKQQAGKSFAQF